MAKMPKAMMMIPSCRFVIVIEFRQDVRFLAATKASIVRRKNRMFAHNIIVNQARKFISKSVREKAV